MDETMPVDDSGPAFTRPPSLPLPLVPRFQVAVHIPARGGTDVMTQATTPLQMQSHGSGFSSAPARTRPRAHDMFNASAATLGLSMPSAPAPANATDPRLHQRVVSSGFPQLAGGVGGPLQQQSPRSVSCQSMGSQLSPSGLSISTAASAPSAAPPLVPMIKTEDDPDDTAMGGVESAVPTGPADNKMWPLDEYLATKIKREEMECQGVHGHAHVFSSNAAPVFPTGGRMDPDIPHLNAAVNATAEVLSVMGVVGATAGADKHIPFNQERMNMLARPKTPSPSPDAEVGPKKRKQTKTNCIPLVYNRLAGEKPDVTPAHRKTGSDVLSLSRKEKMRSEKSRSTRESRDKYYAAADSSPVSSSRRSRRSISWLVWGGGKGREKEREYRQRRDSDARGRECDRDRGHRTKGRDRYRHERTSSRHRYHNDPGRMSRRRRVDGTPHAGRHRPAPDFYRPTQANEATEKTPFEENLEGLIRSAQKGSEPVIAKNARSVGGKNEQSSEISWGAGGDRLRMGLEEEGHFSAFPGRDWVPSGFSSLTINSPASLSFDQQQPMVRGINGQFPLQPVQRFPQLGGFPVFPQHQQFPGVQLESGMLQHQQNSRFQFGTQAQQMSQYPPRIPDIRLALRPFVMYSPLAASDPADPSDRDPGHFVLEWAGENQLRLHAMDLIRSLGLDQDGQLHDLKGLAVALVSDRWLSYLASYYPPQVPIQTPRYFRAYIGAVIESNREAGGLMNMPSQQELKQWFFKLFMPVIEEITKDFTHHPKQEQKATGHGFAASPRETREPFVRDWLERMEAVKRRKSTST